MKARGARVLVNEETKMVMRAKEDAERAALLVEAFTLLAEATPEQIALVLEEVLKW